LLDLSANLGQIARMDADEQMIYDYLLTYGEEWVSAREISRRAGGRKRFAEDNNWARPVLFRLRAARILEADQAGRYRVKPVEGAERKEKWVAPDIEKILKEGGIDVDAEPTDVPLDEPEESDEQF
jgi:hypothetical protein